MAERTCHNGSRTRRSLEKRLYVTAPLSSTPPPPRRSCPRPLAHRSDCCSTSSIPGTQPFVTRHWPSSPDTWAPIRRPHAAEIVKRTPRVVYLAPSVPETLFPVPLLCLTFKTLLSLENSAQTFLVKPLPPCPGQTCGLLEPGSLL